MRRFFGFLAILMLAAAVAACTSYGATKATPTTPAGGLKPGELSVTARYPLFQPSALTLTKGQKVTIRITSSDLSHTFTVDELGLNIQVEAGQTITREFTPEQVGTFKFYCSVPGHRGAGMEGAITVGQ